MPFAILMSVNSALGREIIRAEGRGGLGGRGVWEERVFGDNSSLLNSTLFKILNGTPLRI